MTEQQLRDYTQAWNERDVDRIMDGMTEDCVFHASVGPELLGSTHAGKAAVRAAVEAFFAAWPRCAWVDEEVVVAGDRGFSEWTFRATGADGREVEARGCDLFELRGDLVAVKNAFRKLKPAA
jgi:ketosteroid isomerase-like protein